MFSQSEKMFLGFFGLCVFCFVLLLFFSNVVRKYSSLTTDFFGVLNLKKRTLAKPRKVERRENWWKHSGK